MSEIRSWILRLAVLLVVGGIAPVFGQDAGGSPAGSKDADSDVRLVEVVIDGDSLFSVRGVTAHPAELRAAQIEDRIRALAQDSKISGDSLTVEERPGATWIMAAGQRVMAVTDQDAAVEDIARIVLAELYRVRIGRAIEEYRQYRRAEFLGQHALYALAATGVLVLVAFLASRIFALLRAALERGFRARIEGLEGRTHQIVKGEHIWYLLRGVLKLAWGMGIVVILYVYLNYVLALFPWTRGFSRRLLTIAIDPLRTISLGIVHIIPNIVFLAIFALVIRYGLKIVNLFFEGVTAGRISLTGFEPEWSLPTYRLVRLVVIAFAIVVAYPYIPGSESGAFKGLSLFVGVLFSFGSTSLIGNVIAGYSMTYRRAFRVGDRVKIGEQIGDVEQVRLLVTHLRTVKNEEVVVPNSKILDSEIVNYSSLARERGLILHTTVGIRYDVPWRQVDAMLLEAADRTMGALREPAPYVLKKDFKDCNASYEINVYCDSAQKMASIYTDLHGNILDVFNEYGVQIMTPAYEGDPDGPKIVPRDRWYAAPARPPRADVTTNVKESA
jgi:small-conductance mechanosensitive channel